MPIAKKSLLHLWPSFSRGLIEALYDIVHLANVYQYHRYYIFFGIGFQGVPWLYPTEINSLSMRTKGAALGTASNWAFNYMVSKFPNIMII